MYMGGPDSLEAIEPFLKNLFTDRDIIDFKIGDTLQNFVAGKIAKKRSRKVAPEYAKIGGASPQIKHLDDVLVKVRAQYHALTGRELCTEIGMCYYKPYIEDTAISLNENNYDHIYVMTMYPQYSYTTSGVCFSRLFKSLNVRPSQSAYTVIPDWHMNEKYLECIANRIQAAADELNVPVASCTILYSAHSLPEYTLEKGDVYVDQIKEQIDWLTDRFPETASSLAFQSRTGPMKWIGPETFSELKRLKDENVDHIIVVPISFVSDHIETLIELDDDYIKSARAAGAHIARTDSLNSSDDFAEALVDVIRGSNGKV